MLEHENSWHSLDWLYSLGSMHSSTDQREVLVGVVVALDSSEAADCPMANTADSSKEMVVVVVVVDGVVAETGSDSKVVDSKLVQIFSEGQNVAKARVLGVEV